MCLVALKLHAIFLVFHFILNAHKKYRQASSYENPIVYVESIKKIKTLAIRSSLIILHA